MTPVIAFDSVSKSFRLHRDRPRALQEVFLNLLRLRIRQPTELIWSLRDVSFTVDQGQMVGLIGANGAGKSTALKLVSRIIEPTNGEVHVEGRVNGLLELGAGFHPDLTGRENVYLNGAIMGMGRKEVRRKLDDIVEFSELEQFIDVPVKHYSSGMYMRLGFATAVYSDADVLLVDEVLAVGDQAFQSKCYQRIKELRRDGTTILFVSHDAGTVRRLCDQLVWLDQGRVCSIGDPDTVIADYLDYVWEVRSRRVDAEGSRYDAAQAGGASDRKARFPEQRWGSGEAVISDVIFLGKDGRKRRVFRTGDRFVARVVYESRERVERPTFGVAIYRDDGAHVSGPNSVADGYEIPAIDQMGEMDYVIDALPLLPGRYEFTAAIYDQSSTHPYDHRHRAFTFEVQAGPKGAREGIVDIASKWEHRSKPQTDPQPSRASVSE
jgi:lipopolysaccharide transport system ATP-binding protein